MTLNVEDLTVEKLLESNIPSLVALQHRVKQAINQRHEKERKRLLQVFKETAQASGLSLDDILASPPQSSRRRSTLYPARPSKNKAMYQHPAMPSLTWTGKGRKPNWVKDWIAEGKNLEDLRIRDESSEVGSA